MNKTTDAIAPLYEKVKSYILDKIHSGELPPLSRIPSESELVKTFSVSRMTANRALKELANEGILTRVAGVGTFVSAPQKKGHLLKVVDIAEEVRSRGHDYNNHIIKHEQVLPPPEIATRMGVSANTLTYHTQIIHREEDKPIQLEDRYVNLDAAPEYSNIDLDTTTPSQFLSSIAPLQKANHTVKAAMPSESERMHLEMEDNVPCLILERTTWSQGELISFASLYHSANRYTLSDSFEP